jgi:hypothetical protein
MSTKKGTPRQKRLWVTDEITRELIKEFKTTGTSILNALKFASYSKKASRIRVRAMEKMKDVVESNTVLMSEFHI